MALFHYTSSAAGIGVGTVKSLPYRLAVELSDLGIGYIEKEADLEPSTAQADKVITPAVDAAKTAPKRAKNKKK